MISRIMSEDALQDEIKQAVPMLLKLAREITWNKISDNCKFILSEIVDSNDNFSVQRQLRKKENKRKTPVPFSEIILLLQKLYSNLYDINLEIYKAKKDLTIIDIRYYPKSSLDTDFRLTVLDKPPMLHCKVSMPGWLKDKNEKFDINWEHKKLLIKWKFFLMKRELRKLDRLTKR